MNRAAGLVGDLRHGAVDLNNRGTVRYGNDIKSIQRANPRVWSKHVDQLLIPEIPIVTGGSVYVP